MPEVARGVFHADRLRLAERFVEHLAAEGVVRGLIGPREVPRLWERHVLNCAVVAEAIEPDTRVCDLGSGAGLPGLVLAIARADLEVTLVEPMLRRTDFLEEAVADLGLDRVRVVRARAEELHGRESFDVVTSRALAPLPRLAGWSMPLVADGGSMLCMKGRSAHDEADEAADLLRAHGCAAPEVLVVGGAALEVPTTLVRVRWAGAARVSWRPRTGGGHDRSRSPSARRQGGRPRPRR